MLVNICMKFHEHILNAFKVTERTRFCLRNCYLQSSKYNNSKSIITRVMVLAKCFLKHPIFARFAIIRIIMCLKFQGDMGKDIHVCEDV